MVENYGRIYKTGNDAELVDSSGESLGTKTNRLDVDTLHSNDQRNILNDIYKELKKINIHLAFMTDINIENADVGGY